MGQFITLTNSLGETISAYRADPVGTPKGGMIVVQEIFGVNNHIRNVADSYAKLGYLAIAPALFDHVKPGLELAYGPGTMAEAMATRGKISNEQAVADIAAAADIAAEAGKVGVVGYCWGGALAFLSASRLSGISAAVGYYGGGIASFQSDSPKIPLMLHFGEKDHAIPMDQVDAVKAKFPDLPVYLYDAGHGFNCDERPSYDKASADLALERTLAFFEEHLR